MAYQHGTIPRHTTQKEMRVVHPVLLTVVQLVSTASAISLPLPKLWLEKVLEVKLLARITSLLAADHTDSSGPPTAMVMTPPDVLLSAQQRVCMQKAVNMSGCHAYRGLQGHFECMHWRTQFPCCTIAT